MRFGRFDDERREYVITRPDTPLPWINYLGSEEFLGLISNTAGGYAFHQDARLRRLTRYRYNNAPLDVGGRYIYVRDDASGEYWSPSWQPVGRDVDDYECRHGLGYTTIGSRADGRPNRDDVLRAGRRDTRDLADTRHQRTRRTGPTLAVQRDRVVPLGGQRRRHQLPTQLLDRRGRGRRRRHLPHDRIPRAAQSLRMVRLQRTARRLRDAARRIPRAVPRLGPADRGRARAPERLDRPRLAADGRAPCANRTGARRDARGDLRARLRREPARRQVRPARVLDGRQGWRAPRHRAIPRRRRGRAGAHRRSRGHGTDSSATSR